MTFSYCFSRCRLGIGSGRMAILMLVFTSALTGVWLITSTIAAAHPDQAGLRELNVDEIAASGCASPQFSVAKSFAVGTGPRSIAAADFNLDGRKDMAVANYGGGQGQTNGSISILLNTGSGFSAPSNMTTGTNPRDIVTADFNKDGKPDLAFLNYSTCCIATVVNVLLGDGAGNFVSAGSLNVGSDAVSLTTADFNLDGQIDLATSVVQSPFRSIAILLGNGSGGFSSPTTFTAGYPNQSSFRDHG